MSAACRARRSPKMNISPKIPLELTLVKTYGGRHSPKINISPKIALELTSVRACRAKRSPKINISPKLTLELTLIKALEYRSRNINIVYSKKNTGCQD